MDVGEPKFGICTEDIMSSETHEQHSVESILDAIASWVKKYRNAVASGANSRTVTRRRLLVMRAILG